MKIKKLSTTFRPKKVNEGKESKEITKINKIIFGIVTVLFTLFVIGSMIPWESLIKDLTIFSDANAKLSNLKIGSYSIFNNIIGAPVVVDEMYGSTTGVISAFGHWTMLDLSVFLIIMSGIIALFSRIKPNEYIASVAEGVKKILPTALTTILISIVLVIIITTGVNVTISNTIISLTKGFNIATSTLATVICSVLTADFYYLMQSAGTTMTAYITNSEVYGVLGFILQSVFNFMMIIAPTSIGLITGLYHLDISYSKWFKFIWKLLLALFILIVITSVVIFALI